jgi:hypothetical protein
MRKLRHRETQPLTSSSAVSEPSSWVHCCPLVLGFQAGWSQWVLEDTDPIPEDIFSSSSPLPSALLSFSSPAPALAELTLAHQGLQWCPWSCGCGSWSFLPQPLSSRMSWDSPPKAAEAQMPQEGQEWGLVFSPGEPRTPCALRTLQSLST